MVDNLSNSREEVAKRITAIAGKAIKLYTSDINNQDDLINFNKQSFIDDTHPIVNAVSPYGTTKIVCEQILEDPCKHSSVSGIVMLGGVFGVISIQ